MTGVNLGFLRMVVGKFAFLVMAAYNFVLLRMVGGNKPVFLSMEESKLVFFKLSLRLTSWPRNGKR